MKFILKNEDIRQRAVSHLLDLTFDPPFEVVIRPYKKDRSLEQNARMWALHRAAAEHTGEDDYVLHAIACRMLLGVREVARHARVWEIPNSTTEYFDPEIMKTRKLSVQEMSDFMERLERLYVEQGVPTSLVVDG